jgi:hypothetical protein
MKRMNFLTKKEKMILSLLGILILLIFSINKISNYLLFLQNDSQELVAIKTYENRTKSSYNVEYIYYINGIKVTGTDSGVFFNTDLKKEFVIKVLVNSPGKSIIKEFIIPNMIFNIFTIFTFSALLLFAILGLAGKLPRKYQEKININIEDDFE